jgi:ketosteroid isomerase-like protein
MSMRMLVILAAVSVLPSCAADSGDHGTDASRLSLEQRIQRLEDERDIRELLVLYGEHLDARDYAAYGSLFASDGVWTGGLGSAAGPAAIQKLLEATYGKQEQGFINKESFHLITTMEVDAEGDVAKARSRYLSFRSSPDAQPVVAIAGRYFDDLVREGGKWKFRSRTTHGVIPYREVP